MIRHGLLRNYWHAHRWFRGIITKHGHKKPKPTSTPTFPAGSLSIIQILESIGFTQGMYAGQVAPVKMGYLSLGGELPPADVANTNAAYGCNLPMPTILGKQVSNDQDSNVENSLDWLLQAFPWWWLTDLQPDVTVSFNANATGGMTSGVTTLNQAGVESSSCSWGGPQAQFDSTEAAGLNAEINTTSANGMSFVAASGDSSLDDGTNSPTVDLPAGLIGAIAAGAVSTTVTASGTTFAAWGDGAPGDEGSGGGINVQVPQPTWQQGIVPATISSQYFCRVDLASNGDPDTGIQMSANGAWTVVGGTSESAPFIASLIAVGKGIRKKNGLPPLTGTMIQQLIYENPQVFTDVVTGSDGDPTSPGYDIPTGMGVPVGPAFVNLIATGVVGVPTNPNPPAPPIPPAPPASGLILVASLPPTTQDIPQGTILSISGLHGRRAEQFTTSADIPAGSTPTVYIGSQ